MSREIAEVLGGSKDRKRFGYSVVSETIKTRQHGIQDIPKSIVYETLDDYLKFIKKEKEFRLMMENYRFIKSELPQLEPWLKENPKVIINNVNIWHDLVKVCQWFFLNFEPNKYYISELPIAVHTKFIEENKGVLRVLLDELVPELVNTSESLFEKRFCLKYNQPLIRFRSLDKTCWIEGSYDDITVPVEQFKSTELKCPRVFIIENKMNFLSFPEVPHSWTIWSKGFAIELLKNIEWLKEKEIFYWSDLDVQGFQMLSQLRSCYPQTKSLLMGMEVLEAYAQFLTEGTLSNIKSPKFLSADEMKTFRYLFQNNLRLEQENLNHKFIIHKVNDMLM